MPTNLTIVLRNIAVLTLIVTIVWMVIRPGFDALVAILTAISFLLSLIITDKTKNNPVIPQNPSQNTMTSNFPNTTAQNALIPKTQPSGLTQSSSRGVENLNEWIDKILWVLIIILAIVGAIIGFVMRVHEGAVSGVVGMILGGIAGWFAAGIIGQYILPLTLMITYILWITRWFWLFVALMLVVGYLISGKL